MHRDLTFGYLHTMCKLFGNCILLVYRIVGGAVVTNSFSPYIVIGGCPARLIKFKWTIDEILEHEKILYPEHKRITCERLEEIFDTYIN